MEEFNGYRLRKAFLEDLPEIMAVEKQAFVPGIQEEEETFAKRVQIFKGGFWILEEICNHTDCAKRDSSDLNGDSFTSTGNTLDGNGDSFAGNGDSSSQGDSLTGSGDSSGKKHFNSKTAGYFCCEIWESVPIQKECFCLGHDIADFHKEDGSALYISSVALKNEYKGRGLGKELFNRCVSLVLHEHPKVTDCVLLVNSSWKGARHIYSQAGFKEYDTIEKFFVDGDGILMQKKR